MIDNFDKYLRQGEPNKAEKAKIWKIAIGLQAIDGLKPSEYLIKTATANIEDTITIEEVNQRLNSYYKQYPIKNDVNRIEEADKVSARIAEILSEKSFTFSHIEYISIHYRLFQDIYTHAGKIRDYNISKTEWVLNGESVLYGTAVNIQKTLVYDFQEEKKFSYKNLSISEIIQHIVQFISLLWQNHIFEEGNTRTTAIFLIKYLHKLGFHEVNNDLFANHSWYFRNALVRANYENMKANIYKTDIYLVNFLSNLLLNENHSLKNREMHINYNVLQNDTVNVQNDTANAQNDNVNPLNDTVNPQNDSVFSLIKQNPRITTNEISQELNISLSTASRKIKKLKIENKIQRIGSDKTGYWKIVED